MRVAPPLHHCLTHLLPPSLPLLPLHIRISPCIHREEGEREGSCAALPCCHVLPSRDFSCFSPQELIGNEVERDGKCHAQPDVVAHAAACHCATPPPQCQHATLEGEQREREALLLMSLLNAASPPQRATPLRDDARDGGGERQPA